MLRNCRPRLSSPETKALPERIKCYSAPRSVSRSSSRQSHFRPDDLSTSQVRGKRAESPSRVDGTDFAFSTVITVVRGTTNLGDSIAPAVELAGHGR